MEIWLQEHTGWISITLLVFVAGGVGWFLKWFNAPARKKQREAQHLFRELCRRHRLETRAVRMLRQLASGNALSHPALIFIRPDLFQSSKLPASLQARGEVIDQLRMRLFVAREGDVLHYKR